MNVLNFLLSLQLIYLVDSATGSIQKFDVGVTNIGSSKLNGRLRFPRQNNANKKDPYKIAQLKCEEYGNARYAPPSRPGRRPILNCVTVEPLISGGVPARLKEFPHMALIGFSDNSNNANDALWRCGGSLISDRFVLTAAHCIRAENYLAKWVRLGELVVDDDRDYAEVKDVLISERIPHPDYKAPSIYNDIMLFKLQETIKFNSHIRPICLHTPGSVAVNVGSEGIITGWGVTGAGETQSEALLKAKIKVANDRECISYYKNDKNAMQNGYDVKNMICAGDKVKKRDTCQADSGGPFQVLIPKVPCMFYQVGITSFGPLMCGQANVSAIYTKVSPYISWIQPIVWPQ